jgi:drug/metabolite transporter (DMT)-like permease
MVSVAVLAIVLALMGRLHKVGWLAFAKIAGCGGILALHWVAFFASIQASNVSIGVACIATSCFFTTLLDPLINRKRISWIEVLISFIAISGVLLIFSLDWTSDTGWELHWDCCLRHNTRCSRFSI